ncbi:MAG: archease [Candidatus Pacearchaeota archaeon]
MRYKFLQHTADAKFNAYGSTLEKSFENSALAMLNLIYAGKVKEKTKKTFNVSGKDFESLLYNFLEEFLILADSEGFLASKIKVKIDRKNLRLKAEVSGDDAENYNFSASVKAVTYNHMFVKKINNKWVCQVVLDV